MHVARVALSSGYWYQCDESAGPHHLVMIEIPQLSRKIDPKLPMRYALGFGVARGCISRVGAFGKAREGCVPGRRSEEPNGSGQSPLA